MLVMVIPFPGSTDQKRKVYGPPHLVEELYREAQKAGVKVNMEVVGG
jgi:hypothetical protein